MKRRSESGPDERFSRWERHLNAAFEDITEVFWKRRLFRAVREMFIKNAELHTAPGNPQVWEWIQDMYGHYAVMVIRRELDSQQGTLTLTSMLHDMEKNPHVLAAYARGRPIPQASEIRRDREALERQAKKGVAFANRLIAHRTSDRTRTLSFADLDEGLRAVRAALLKY